MNDLVVLRLNLEVCLGMRADRADFGGSLAHDDMSAVRALPNLLVVTGENESALDVLKQFFVPLLVLLLNLRDALEEERNGSKPSSLASFANFAYISVHS